jgi:hypothetical protein
MIALPAVFLFISEPMNEKASDRGANGERGVYIPATERA